MKIAEVVKNDMRIELKLRSSSEESLRANFEESMRAGSVLSPAPPVLLDSIGDVDDGRHRRAPDENTTALLASVF